MIKNNSIFKKRLISVMAAVGLLFAGMAAPIVNAAQLNDRSLTLSSSAPSETTTHTYNFEIPTTGNVGSIRFLYCTAASGACTTPTGLTTTAATLTAQTGATSFTINNTTNGSPYITRTAASVTGGAAVSYTLSDVVNPSTANETFYVRMTTYTGTDGATGAVDNGVVATSTANQIIVNASVDETLVFCTGTSGITNSSCSGATGTAVNLGSLTSSTTGSGTSQIGVSTNAGSGYAVTINGDTLTSGVNTIAALASQTASTQGSAQFGINLRDNTTPNVGVDPSGAGTATPTANFNTVDQFRFVTGDSVASKASSDDFRLFTVSYIANIPGNQPAGGYSTTLEYVATATF